MALTNQDILSLARESDVKFIRLQFTDLFGQMKNLAILIDHLEEALDGCYMFDGSSVDGFVRIEESDMVLRPDPSTFTVFPWRPQNGRVGRLICDVHYPDGSPFEGDPRRILRRVVEDAASMGYTLKIGAECEFFLFHTDPQGRPTTITHDDGGYFDLGPVDMGEDARRDICMALEDMGFNIEASHHEVAPGQHEIDFRYAEALQAADDMMTFRMAVKTVAKRHGLAATFMPKPREGVNGSGLHANLSLWKDGRNAFCDETAPGGLSPVARGFAAGIMAHIDAITALANPLVNSYKRLIPGYEAPVYVCWARHNRSPLIRVPDAGGEGTRLELRSPDPSCNPYLAFAAICAAGLDGLRRELTPPPMLERNIYRMDEGDRDAMGGLRRLPVTLADALDALERDRLILDAIGPHAAENYIKAKRMEYADYSSRVHQWETDRYLTRY